jgi:hypothetical protein
MPLSSFRHAARFVFVGVAAANVCIFTRHLEPPHYPRLWYLCFFHVVSLVSVSELWYVFLPAVLPPMTTPASASHSFFPAARVEPVVEPRKAPLASSKLLPLSSASLLPSSFKPSSHSSALLPKPASSLPLSSMSLMPKRPSHMTPAAVQALAAQVLFRFFLFVSFISFVSFLLLFLLFLLFRLLVLFVCNDCEIEF